MAQLKCIQGTPPENGALLELPQEGTAAIGRAPGKEVKFPETDRGVSRNHARIRVMDGNYVLADEGSTGGTFVNGDRITGSAVLKNGDQVRVGTCLFEFVLPPVVPVASAGKAAAASDGEAAPKPQDVYNQPFQDRLYSDAVMSLKRRIHEMILQRMNLPDLVSKQVQDEAVKGRVNAEMENVFKEVRHQLPDDIPLDVLRQSVEDEFLGYGPITPYLREPNLEEIMVNGPNSIFVAKSGKMLKTQSRFYDDAHVMRIISRIVEPLGKHIDEASPMANARLPDGSRVNAVIPPLALNGPTLTIRKFFAKKPSVDDLVIKYGSMTAQMAEFLREAVRARQNIVVAGGTGSGKTTLLNVLSLFIPEGERIITVEDSAELQLNHPNLVRLETRPPNIEGKGSVEIRDLVINCLRMRPDRIIVGECRGPEAFDMLQAMNTGHDGSLTTVHANGARDTLSRMENMVMMGVELPSQVIREQIASAINLIVYQARLADGTRKVMQIAEVTGREKDVILMQDIFLFKRTSISQGKIEGHFAATGNIPRFLEELRDMGDLRIDLGMFGEGHESPRGGMA